jgi:hypothetical protein
VTAIHSVAGTLAPGALALGHRLRAVRRGVPAAGTAVLAWFVPGEDDRSER